MVNNKIGYSLPFDFVSGESTSEYNMIFGSVEECLLTLHSAGVNSIELRRVDPTASVEVTRKAFDAIAKCEMVTTIHGNLPEISSGIYLMPAISALPIDDECIVTLHSYAGTDYSLDWYADETVEAMRKLLENTEDTIKFALEINRAKTYNDPGVTYKGLIDMIDAIGSERLGACWDFGHTAVNIHNGLMDLLPPDEFPSKVIHTHIHDLSEKAKTHFPLTCGRIPLNIFDDLLLNTGYSGCFNLELSVQLWPGTAEEKRDAIIQSIEILAKSLDKGYS